jgi:outer membrane protein assembly factor BamB
VTPVQSVADPSPSTRTPPPLVLVPGTFRVVARLWGDRPAVATDDGDLYVLNTAGDLVALAAFETPVRSSPVIVDGDVYFGTKRGTLRVLTDL